VKGAKFLWLEPEWIGELDSIRDIIKRAWRALAVSQKSNSLSTASILCDSNQKPNVPVEARLRTRAAPDQFVALNRPFRRLGHEAGALIGSQISSRSRV
jgi:hypothetical protein